MIVHLSSTSENPHQNKMNYDRLLYIVFFRLVGSWSEMPKKHVSLCFHKSKCMIAHLLWKELCGVMVKALLARKSNIHPPVCYTGPEIHLQNAFVCWLPIANEKLRQKTTQLTGYKWSEKSEVKVTFLSGIVTWSIPEMCSVVNTRTPGAVGRYHYSATFY